MPLGRSIVKGLVYTIDLTKLADRELPSGSTQTLEEYRRTVEAPVSGYREPFVIEWGDGTSNTYTSTVNLPTHTYANNAGNVFQVIVRSVSGRMPGLPFSGDSTDTPEKKITVAVTGIDHFAGTIGADTVRSYYGAFRNTVNLRYYDARMTALPTWNAMTRVFQNSGIEQIEPNAFEFCSENTNLSSAFQGCTHLTAIPAGLFDNQPNVNTINAVFSGCTHLTAIPAGLFDNCVSLINTDYAFNSCSRIAGEPYAFWNQSYAANITTKSNTYRNCSGALKAQVPEDYGGTMTVS